MKRSIVDRPFENAAPPSVWESIDRVEVQAFKSFSLVPNPMDYAVSREGTTLVTLHGGSDTTACDEATAQLSEALAGLAADDAISEWSIDDAAVYEHPNAPFDPYTVTVAFSVTIAVAADDEATAEERGTSAIDDALAEADVDAVSFTSGPATSTV